MKEIILQITEKEGFDKKPYMSGYEIVTNKQKVILGIDNDQNCCEDWGYLLSEDKISNFIGSELKTIKVVKVNRTKKNLDEDYLYDGTAMFIDIVTSIGILQFVAYNIHNGYYGHGSCVISNQLNFNAVL